MRVRAGGAGGQDQIDGVRPADEGGHRGFHGIGFVLHVVDGHDRRAEALDLRPDAGLEALARRRTDGFLDDHADAAGNKPGHPEQRATPEVGQPCAGVHGRRLDEVRRDLDARHQIARFDHLAVEDREDLERIDPVEPFKVTDANVDDPVDVGQQVHAALRRPTIDQAGTGHRGGQAERRFVFVELAGVGNEDADRIARSGSGQSRQIFGAQPATLRPTAARDRQVAGENRSDEACGRTSARSDPFDAYRVTPGDAGPNPNGRARPRSRGACRPPPSGCGTHCPRGCPH